MFSSPISQSGCELWGNKNYRESAVGYSGKIDFQNLPLGRALDYNSTAHERNVHFSE